MTVHMHRPLRGAIDVDVLMLQGSFAPNGTSAVDATQNQGKGFSVSRTGVGTFTVTLDETYNALLAATASLQLHTADDKVVQFGDVDLVARTVVMRVWDISGAAVADIAANSNNRINFALKLRYSTVK